VNTFFKKSVPLLIAGATLAAWGALLAFTGVLLRFQRTFLLQNETQ